jgi:ketosteroid isomerase-like protein
MISSDPKGADLESRVASWAASATSDDAAVVHAVIETYGDQLAAADVAAVMQPELEAVVGSQHFTATYDAAFENMRLDFTFRFDEVTVKGDLAAVKATSQGTITSALPAYATSASPAAVRSATPAGPLEVHAVHVPAGAGAVRRGLLRHLASPPPGFAHFPHPLSVAEHDAAPAVTLIYLPVQGPCRQTSA